MDEPAITQPIMRFRIEQLNLTDDSGRPVVPREAVLHVVEAPTVEEALDKFMNEDHAQLIGDLLRFPGLQAVATLRKDNKIYTLQVQPVSDWIDRRQPPR